jgi:hypothetical protein
MDRKKNIWDMATTPPIKKPTAILLWNFRIIIVPPMLKVNNKRADHTLAKPSAKDRVDMTAHDKSAKIAVRPKIEYLNDKEKSTWTRRLENTLQ